MEPKKQYQYRDLAWLVPQLQSCAVKRDWQAAQRLAADVLALAPEERETLELLTGVYIDLSDTEHARQAWGLLCRTCGENAYSRFLSARIAFLRHDWQRAELDGEKALHMGGLSSEEQALAHDILGRTAKELGDTEAAAAHHAAAAGLAGSLEERRISYSNYLLDLHYHTEDEESILRAARGYKDLFSDVRPYDHQRHTVHEKLRIGYISPDLRSHIVAYFSWAMFQSYDHACFEIYCYANCEEDAISQTFAALSGHWCNIRNMTPAETARRIHEDEIDILVDLAGHTEGNCLPVLACRPAPVQVSGIGYMSTTGLDTIDYFLGDVYLDGPEREGEDRGFTERLLRLPHSHFCYRPPQPDIPCAPAPCRKNGYITFGCFNTFAKLTPELLTAWSRLLERVPDARLFLKAAVFDNDYGAERARQRLREAGIPLQRVELAGYTADYLEAYARVDIALDTYPYPGGGTTCDALYMGVPVITLAGHRHGARFGCSLLMNIGLAECCASSWEEYIDRAAELAADREKLQDLHRTIRRRMRQSFVMAQGRYMAELEAAYQQIWQQRVPQAPEDRMQEARQRSVRLLAALQCSQWEVVVREAGRLHAMGCIAPQAVSAAGFAYLQCKDYDRAVFWLRLALKENPENAAELYAMLGEALREGLDAAEAGSMYGAAWEALQADGTPGSAAFRSQLLVSRANILHALGDAENSAAAYLEASRLSENLRDTCDLYSSYLLVLNCMEADEQTMAKAHQAYAALFAEVQPFTHGLGRTRPKRLRIGYISPDFRQHVMFSFYYALLACADRSRFEVHCYSLGGQRDAYTEKVKAITEVWHDMAGCSYGEIADRIHSDGIDILVDLAGHTANSGLPVLAWHPAPVQVSGLGYMNRTGLPAVDYFITDRWCDPAGSGPAAGEPEQPLYLPSQFSYAANAAAPEVQGTPCRQKGFVLFASFNHYYKITDDMLGCWLEILQRVPGARLLLKSQVMVNPSAVDIAYERLKRLGFDMERVIFEPATSNYLQRYLDVDIALDTYPYTGGGTTCDALYMGVPVISMYGERRGSRFGRSILESSGAGSLAAASREEYIEKAAALAADMDTLEALHLGLRALMQQSVLMDGCGYVRALEAQYDKIWNLAMRGGEANGST